MVKKFIERQMRLDLILKILSSEKYLIFSGKELKVFIQFFHLQNLENHNIERNVKG